MSLRLRLFLMGALVALVAVAAVWLVAGQRVEGEFQRYLVRDDHARFARLAGDIQVRVARGESTAQVSAALARAAAGLRGPVVWLDPAARYVAGSDSSLARRASSSTRLASCVSSACAERRAAAQRTRWSCGSGCRRSPLTGPGGTYAGALWLFPPFPDAPPLAGPSGEAGFHSGVTRGLVHAGLAGLLVAVIASLVLGRALARSIEELTQATRAVAAGDRTRRVPVRGKHEIATLAASFNALVDSIDRGERLRKNLVADVAHELRTPVTNLRAQVEAIEDGLLAPTPEALASLREEIVLLARLIDELQELSLAEAGALALARGPLALDRAVASALAAAAARAQAAGITLASEVPALPPVDADPARVAQVLRSLLDNALRHTPSGGRVTIAARAAGAHVEVSVTDTGEGIAPEHVPHVFERLYRADPSRDRRTGGAGLGLSVVKRLVEAHGGTATLESAPGRGTTVRFTLPIAS